MSVFVATPTFGSAAVVIRTRPSRDVRPAMFQRELSALVDTHERCVANLALWQNNVKAQKKMSGNEIFGDAVIRTELPGQRIDVGSLFFQGTIGVQRNQEQATCFNRRRVLQGQQGDHGEANSTK